MTQPIIEPPRLTVDECIERNDSVNHPTDIVMACSPDPVLTHDGETSQACRRCHCGRAGRHVDGCLRPEAVREREDRARTQAKINARPLDVLDISGARRHAGLQHEKMGDHWYWCRAHGRAENVGWAMDGCVRVGPFMSEREANRLKGAPYKGPYSGAHPPLGMEVEV